MTQRILILLSAAGLLVTYRSAQYITVCNPCKLSNGYLDTNCVTCLLIVLLNVLFVNRRLQMLLVERCMRWFIYALMWMRPHSGLCWGFGYC